MATEGGHRASEDVDEAGRERQKNKKKRKQRERWITVSRALAALEKKKKKYILHLSPLHLSHHRLLSALRHRSSARRPLSICEKKNQIRTKKRKTQDNHRSCARDENMEGSTKLIQKCARRTTSMTNGGITKEKATQAALRAHAGGGRILGASLTSILGK